MITFAVSSVQRNACRETPSTASPVASLKAFAKEGCKDIVQGTKLGSVVASESGFVRGVIEAYNEHLDLVLRPDDIWLAILIQFGMYVDGHAEELRSSLVKHDGQKELVVYASGTLYSVDIGALSKQMVDKMDEHLVDPSLKHWVLPSFSTTTDHDVIVASVVLMATMKTYFSYKFCLRCGIPQVTLLGTVGDWEDIRRRLDELAAYGERMTQWAAMLAPILDQFVAAAKGHANVAFWDRICSHQGGGSGPSYLSGWISVFCVFSDKGEWQGDHMSEMRWERKPDADVNGSNVADYVEVLVPYDYPLVDMEDIPPGYLTVDVTIDDNGIEHKALMFAGHMAYAVGGNQTSIAPSLSWAIALKNGEPAPPSKRELLFEKRAAQRAQATAANEH
ncbi:hypothetical protein SPRG_12639 [Saprolegnia parasitica CBS 223.65]|uniref:Uncharacterized protein n=1 Tax=Saprolegnia parasitica (strain CBS 223.65) TaxID=695850 RepID=A0A067C4U0_SAPPC|nr:hypothetical protein SPRG_12639 [Saprolegnia parasitica CBS 223.65]KDO21822.1 hypothetical protein SPRG_12639 [Saprolegnia parasitica CBS 223.65]|eukprot:XP_012207499.1 hypothetical protein SPRG_12639 [Saprolegnia parasitica CBS 223.65]